VDVAVGGLQGEGCAMVNEAGADVGGAVGGAESGDVAEGSWEERHGKCLKKRRLEVRGPFLDGAPAFTGHVMLHNLVLMDVQWMWHEMVPTQVTRILIRVFASACLAQTYCGVLCLF